VSEITVDDLRALDLLEGLSEEELSKWAAVAVEQRYDAEEKIVEQGDWPGLLLLLEGEVDNSVVISDGRSEPVTHMAAPTWIGAVAALTGSPIAVRVLATTPVRLAVVDSTAFVDLCFEKRVVFQRVMAVVRPVLGRITAVEQNRERLASLGTMAAGLAHELNNPAAAAKSAASELVKVLDVLGSTIGIFVESGIEREDAARLVAMKARALERAEAEAELSALDAADAEDALADVLTEAGVADGYRIAEPLVRAGVDEAFVEEAAALAGPATSAALQWIAGSITAHELASELRESTDRMSGLVKAIKQYAYMDRGQLVDVDLREGLDTTVTILGHKLKHSEIEVVRDYDESLPKLVANGAELNQVWTNLIDNAIDALGDTGTITLTTRRDGDCAEVDIADDGPGIPDDVRSHIFDPFFTTKEVGQGTGLGLDTARRIIVDRHRGSLNVESEPGRTVFRIRLPLEAKR
jgi:signal transduction histidine kinase